LLLSDVGNVIEVTVEAVNTLDVAGNKLTLDSSQTSGQGNNITQLHPSGQVFDPTLDGISNSAHTAGTIHEFSMDEGFPTMGYAGATFNIYLKGTGEPHVVGGITNYSYRNYYKWTVDQPHVKLKVTNYTMFELTGTGLDSSNNTVTITGTPIDGASTTTPVTYTFTLRKWFKASATSVSKAQAQVFCASEGMQITETALMTNDSDMAENVSTATKDVNTLWGQWMVMSGETGFSSFHLSEDYNMMSSNVTGDAYTYTGSNPAGVARFPHCYKSL
ncbi:MAG: hypothetical protein ACRCX0_00495, partial [Plesiomonas sp.]